MPRVIYTVLDLLGLRDDPNRWIVPGMLPHPSKTIMYGQGSSYKSTIIFDLCVAVASGGLMLTQFPVKKWGPVFLVSTEGSIYDNKDRILYHCRAHDVNPANVDLHFCQDSYNFDEPSDVEEFEWAVRQIEPLLCVLDPLDSFFDGDENSAKETKHLRKAINRISNEMNTSFILIHHESKKKDLRGSTAWYGWADVVLHSTTSKVNVGMPDGPREMVTVEALKQRNGRRGHLFSALPIIDNAMRTTTFAVYDGASAENVSIIFLAHLVFRYLKEVGKPLTNKQMQAALRMRTDQITPALDLLEAKGMVRKDGAAIAEGIGRSVPGWRIMPKYYKVDAAKALLDAERREETDAYSIYPELPDGYGGDDDGLRTQGVDVQPGVPAVGAGMPPPATSGSSYTARPA